MNRNKKEVTFASKLPKCWPVDKVKDFVLWKDAARTSAINKKSSVCEDCTPEYKELMLNEGKCENPEIVFATDEDGFIFGRLPLQKELTDKCNAQNVPLEQKSSNAEELEEGENA